MAIKKSTTQEVRKDINPQLAKVFNPAKHKWEHPWLAEPKFDGLRCIVILDSNGIAKAYSRNGKPLWNMEKILGEVEDVMYECWVHQRHKDFSLVLDGEVYTKDWNLSMSIVKRSTQTHPDQDKLRYHVWDCLTLEELKAGKSLVSNGYRRERLFSFIGGEYVNVVMGKLVSNNEELQEVYKGYLDEGYEGVIIKNLQGIYECGRRSPNWLKLKPWSDADLTVVGSYPGEGKHLGRIGGLILEGTTEWNGKLYTVKTEVGTGFTDMERVFFQALEKRGKLIGRIVEIHFQSIAEDTGACRFPVYARLREDKE